MQVTEYGKKHFASKSRRADYLSMAIAHLFRHHTPLADFEESLRFFVAQCLAGRNHERPLAMREECEGWEEFIHEKSELIEPLVQEAIEGARASMKQMGLA